MSIAAKFAEAGIWGITGAGELRAKIPLVSLERKIEQIFEELIRIRQEIKDMSTTVNAGLAALQAADANLAAAVTAAIADITSLTAQLAAATSGLDSDSAVATIAADLQSKVDALNAALAPPAPAAPPAAPAS